MLSILRPAWLLEDKMPADVAVVSFAMGLIQQQVSYARKLVTA
jgi:hypothetical protein